MANHIFPSAVDSTYIKSSHSVTDSLFLCLFPSPYLHLQCHSHMLSHSLFLSLIFSLSGITNTTITTQALQGPLWSQGGSQYSPSDAMKRHRSSAPRLSSGLP